MSDIWSSECEILESTNQGVLLILKGCKSSLVNESLIDVGVAICKSFILSFAHTFLLLVFALILLLFSTCLGSIFSQFFIVSLSSLCLLSSLLISELHFENH